MIEKIIMCQKCIVYISVDIDVKGEGKKQSVGRKERTKRISCKRQRKVAVAY